MIARLDLITSHGNPFYATAGAPYLAEGEAAVVRPLGKDFEIVARVRHDGWKNCKPEISRQDAKNAKKTEWNSRRTRTNTGT